MGIRSLRRSVKQAMQSAKEYKREEEKWLRTRGNDDEYYTRANQLQQNGLNAMVHFDELHGNLYAIVVEPADDSFIHLVNDVGVAEAKSKGEQYRISICYTRDIQTTWQHKQIEHLEQKYSTPQLHHFNIIGITKGATALIDHNDSIYKDIIELHRHGHYWFKEIHISM